MSKSGQDTSGQKFIFDDQHRLVVHVDGACINQGQEGARAGAGVWFNENHPRNVYERVPGPQAAANAEIQAALRAVEIGKKAGFRDIRIKCDAEEVVRNMKNPQSAPEEFHQLRSACQGLNVNFERIPGHAGHMGNEGAHMLAQRGAEMSRQH